MRLLLFLLIFLGVFPSFAQRLDDGFTISEISPEIFRRIDGLSYKEGCDIALDDLRYLRVLHVDSCGVTHRGELICNRRIAQDLVDIFRVLYARGYPIERISLVDDYGAEDRLSMISNNSSAFNYRYISGSRRLSNHSFGMAVDINPLYNPYVKVSGGVTKVDPVEAARYSDRTLFHPYMIQKGDLLYREFLKRGFVWGGDWRTLKDYQHFEKPL